MLLSPARDPARLGDAASDMFQAMARAVLHGSLPAEEPARSRTLAELPARIEGVVAQLPPHSQAELAQLVTVLSSALGRRALAGVAAPWSEATTADIQRGLQAMRLSRWTVRRQAYQALHDLIGGAYFSDPKAWRALGYPGPGVTFS